MWRMKLCEELYTFECVDFCRCRQCCYFWADMRSLLLYLPWEPPLIVDRYVCRYLFISAVVLRENEREFDRVCRLSLIFGWLIFKGNWEERREVWLCIYLTSCSVFLSESEEFEEVKKLSWVVIISIIFFIFF